eukprot:CAMPEP_0114553718 /NCGR_PEP_ID=MMETSP0114-20121206/7821_1 /TAXON_ID=31324 /ORGANISM="Goniomonas sp, Strain m" /LENGTH=72 /DNA_ID=CAMNT_0001738707 /DNA_START=25 /DNA_END=243 /DNA_ORIENTATION=-
MGYGVYGDSADGFDYTRGSYHGYNVSSHTFQTIGHLSGYYSPWAGVMSQHMEFRPTNYDAHVGNGNSTAYFN